MRTRLALVAVALNTMLLPLAPAVSAQGDVVVTPGDQDGLYGSPTIDLGAMSSSKPPSSGRPGTPGSVVPKRPPGGSVPLGLSWLPLDGGPEGFTVVPQLGIPDFTEESPPALPSPGTLALQAAERLRLPLPTPSHSPDIRFPDGRSGTVVGEHTWFWTTSADWRPHTERVQAGPVWAEVTATPVRLAIEPGNAQPPVACAGPGTPYDRSYGVHAASPDCGVLYERSSATEPGEQVRVRWSITWHLSWHGFDGTAPTGGTLSPITSRADKELVVVEAQALTTG